MTCGKDRGTEYRSAIGIPGHTGQGKVAFRNVPEKSPLVWSCRVKICVQILASSSCALFGWLKSRALCLLILVHHATAADRFVDSQSLATFPAFMPTHAAVLSTKSAAT